MEIVLVVSLIFPFASDIAVKNPPHRLISSPTRPTAPTSKATSNLTNSLIENTPDPFGVREIVACANYLRDRLPVKHFHAALQFDQQRMSFAIQRLAGGHLDPAFADAIFLDVVALLAIDANADTALDQRGIVKRAARVDGEAIGKRGELGGFGHVDFCGGRVDGQGELFHGNPRPVAPAACISSRPPHLQAMLNPKLSWKRPLFYLLLPVFVVMIFLGFQIPVPPPPEIKPGQEQSQPAGTPQE